MLRIRSINLTDFEKLAEIHEKFYKEEFDFPDFLDKYLCVAVVENEGEIICAGGVRTLAESVIVTNKQCDLHTKLEALGMMREANEFICKQFGYDQLHAFVQNDESWRAWLKRAGFKETKGKSYYLNVR